MLIQYLVQLLQQVVDDVNEGFFSDIPAEVCTPFSEDFSIIGCMKLLIVPTSGQIAALTADFMNNVGRVFPLGYVTRLVEIVSLQEATMPPALSYTFGTSAPEELEGRTLSYQIFDYFGFVAEIEADDGSGKNVWDIINPYIQVIVSLGVLGVILFDLMQLGVPHFYGSDTGNARVVRNGEVPVTQLPESTDSRKGQYEAQSVVIRNKTRR